MVFLLEIYKRLGRNPEINGLLIEPVHPESSEVCYLTCLAGGVEQCGWKGRGDPRGLWEVSKEQLTAEQRADFYARAIL